MDKEKSTVSFQRFYKVGTMISYTIIGIIPVYILAGSKISTPSPDIFMINRTKNPNKKMKELLWGIQGHSFNQIQLFIQWTFKIKELKVKD